MLDTNFLMAMEQFKVDIFGQLEGEKLFTVRPVIDELTRMADGRSRKARAARIALLFLEKKHVKVLESEKKADDALVDYASQGYAVATQDRKLKARVKRAGAKALYIRQKRYVVSI